MNESVVDATFREVGSSVAIRPNEPPSVNLMGTDDPQAMVEKATAIATALFKVVEDRKLYKVINGKKHLFVEAWQFMGMMMGVTTFAEWSRPVEGGWEARAVVRTAKGIDIGAAEAQCLRSESRWRTADDYAVRSMALTRATSKALRSVLAFIAVLAGYAPTPEAEMPDPTPPSQPSSAPRGLTKNEAAAAKATAEGPCADCHAPAGKPHATACPQKRSETWDAEAKARDAAPSVPSVAREAAEPTPNPQPRASAQEAPATGISEGQRRLLFATLKGTGFEVNDLARHAWLETIGVPPSTSAWSASDFEFALKKAEELPRR